MPLSKHVLNGATALVIFFITSLSALAGEANFKSCYARWTDTELVIGNSHIERKWQLENGLLKATSFRDLATGIDWIRDPAKRPAPIPADTLSEETRTTTINTKTGRMTVTEEESLVVEITATGKRSLSHRLQIFPDARGIAMRFHDAGAAVSAKKANTAATKSKTAADQTTGVETTAAAKDEQPLGDSLEHLLLSPQHLRFTQVHMLDRTDAHTELVFENESVASHSEGA